MQDQVFEVVRARLNNITRVFQPLLYTIQYLGYAVLHTCGYCVSSRRVSQAKREVGEGKGDPRGPGRAGEAAGWDGDDIMPCMHMRPLRENPCLCKVPWPWHAMFTMLLT